TWSYVREQQMYEVFVNIDGYYHRVAVDPDLTPYHNGRLSSAEAVNGLDGSSFTAVEVWGRRTSINTSDRKDVSAEAHYWANKLIK
ncbi:MAG: hypothetical protein NTY66_03225, partial [Candidatus Vogelbacteria bacterium]|nr:hypothetical protein [Candidatus Vogelbacteria bacterium]